MVKQETSPILVTYLEDAGQQTGSGTIANKDDHAAETITKLLKPTDDPDGAGVERASFIMLDFVQSNYLRERGRESDLDTLARLIPALKKQAGNEYEQFGWQVRDAWNYDDSNLSGEELSNVRERWRYLNGFVARASHYDPTLLLNGLWILRSALEDNDNIKANIPAAAQWVVHAGKAIFKSRETFKTSNQPNDPARPGQNFKGPSGFNQERWCFWKDAFEKHAKATTADEKVKNWSEKAVEAMNQVEKAG